MSTLIPAMRRCISLLRRRSKSFLRAIQTLLTVGSGKNSVFLGSVKCGARIRDKTVLHALSSPARRGDLQSAITPPALQITTRLLFRRYNFVALVGPQSFESL